MLLILCWHLQIELPAKPGPCQILELFAGQARLSRLGTSLGLSCHAHDVTYDERPAGESAMDINGSAGYVWGSELFLLASWRIFKFFLQLRLAILSILRSKDDDLITLAGIVCSSWVSLNAGTSGRDYVNPMGRSQHPSVHRANKMMSRCLA